MSLQTDDMTVPDTAESLVAPTSKELLAQLDDWLKVSTDRTMFSCTEMQNFLIDCRSYIRSVDSGAFAPTVAPLHLPPSPEEDEDDGFDPTSLLS